LGPAKNLIELAVMKPRNRGGWGEATRTKPLAGRFRLREPAIAPNPALAGRLEAAVLNVRLGVELSHPEACPERRLTALYDQGDANTETEGSSIWQRITASVLERLAGAYGTVQTPERDGRGIAPRFRSIAAYRR